MSAAGQIDLLRCPRCLRRFLVGDAAARDSWSCPACEHELQLMVRSLPGPASRAASVLGAKVLRPLEL
jgi:hypothetical protein